MHLFARGVSGAGSVVKCRPACVRYFNSYIRFMIYECQIVNSFEMKIHEFG